MFNESFSSSEEVNGILPYRLQLWTVVKALVSRTHSLSHAHSEACGFYGFDPSVGTSKHWMKITKNVTIRCNF